jgi:hypothetical protein
MCGIRKCYRENAKNFQTNIERFVAFFRMNVIIVSAEAMRL